MRAARSSQSANSWSVIRAGGNSGSLMPLLLELRRPEVSSSSHGDVSVRRSCTEDGCSSWLHQRLISAEAECQTRDSAEDRVNASSHSYSTKCMDPSCEPLRRPLGIAPPQEASPTSPCHPRCPGGANRTEEKVGDSGRCAPQMSR